VICRDLQPGARYLPRVSAASNNRSKFNVAFGVEAQGFCLIR
jgi:hypothetical protein